jgi:hypothetical protein
MSRFDQAKMLMRVKKIQNELQKMTISSKCGLKKQLRKLSKKASELQPRRCSQ